MVNICAYQGYTKHRLEALHVFLKKIECRVHLCGINLCLEHPSRDHRLQRILFSASFLAEISVSSPRKTFIFIILKKNLDQSIQKKLFI